MYLFNIFNEPKNNHHVSASNMFRCKPLFFSGKQWFSLNPKGTLMQIWKSPYMFVFKWKGCPEKLAFLILGILELHNGNVCEMFVYKHIETIENVKN